MRKTQVAAPVAGLVATLTVRDGDAVEAAQVLAELDTEPSRTQKRTLEVQRLEASARLRAAEAKQRRAQDLFEAQLLAAESIEETRFEVEALAARRDALTAQIEELALAIRQAAIRAPFTGVVSQKLIEVGMWARVGDPVFEIVATDNLEVRVDVPEAHFPKLRLGQAASLHLDALPGLRLAGEVKSLAAEAQPSARTFAVKISIPSQNGAVRAGMLASVEFAPAAPRTVTLAPKDALVETNDGWVVFSLNSESVVHAVKVRMGDAVGQWVEVSGAVAPGTQVVIFGNERLRDGQLVSARSRELPRP